MVRAKAVGTAGSSRPARNDSVGETAPELDVLYAAHDPPPWLLAATESRSVIIRADCNMSACQAARQRGALSLVSEESSSSRWRHSCARLWSRMTGLCKSPGQAVRSRMAATGPSRCSVGPGRFPGRRDQLAPQDGHDRKPAVPTLDEAPDAGDRDIGKDRGNHVGGGRQCPRQHVRAAIRRRRRRPGHGHRFPPSRAADGARRVLAPPAPLGQLDLLPAPLVVAGQRMA